MKLKACPKDFTFAEAETLLKYLGYDVDNKGKTSGSRVSFSCPGRQSVMLHRPHPQKELPEYQVKQMIKILEKEKLI